jgi:hypothetical protein
MPAIPNIRSRSGRSLIRVTALALTIGAASMALSACGGAATGNAASKSSSGQRGAGFAALRACLQKNGINLPQRPAGAGGPTRNGGPRPGGGFGGGRGSFQPPPGASGQSFRAAMQKCGGRNFGAGRQANNPAYRQGLTKFVSCMRTNGIKLPNPNTSGTGPIFKTSGINVNGAKFMAARAKCQSVLPGRFGSGPSAGGRPGGPPPGA